MTAIIICGCYNPRRFSSKTTKSPPPVPTTSVATYEVVGFNKKESNTIELESNSAMEQEDTDRNIYYIECSIFRYCSVVRQLVNTFFVFKSACRLVSMVT